MPVAMPILRKGDKEKDPEVDPEAIKKIMEILRESDINKDGGYSKEELKHALKNLGALFPAWRAFRCFGKADTNKDGQIRGNEIDTLVEYLFAHGFGK